MIRNTQLNQPFLLTYNKVSQTIFHVPSPDSDSLVTTLAQQCHKVSLHTILIGVMGTIYKCHTELPLSLSKLGLDRCRVSNNNDNLLSI